MSTEDALIKLLAADGPISRRLDGYTPRRAQMDMALEVLSTLQGDHSRLVVEAGTGTGKSLAYLAAALLSDQQVIVATGTKALQDQLIQKDIPVVLDALLEQEGLDKQAALMKGRGNYLCLARFDRFEREPRFAFADEASAWPLLQKWANTTETGDRGEIEALPDAFSTWHDLDASSETCIGQKCEHFVDCYVTRMRKKAELADLIVVNHHLLCADQRVRLEGLPAARDAAGDDGQDNGFAQVIPYADAFIIDEAHALPDVASDYFGVSLSSTRVERLLRDLRRSAESMPQSRRLAVLGAGQRLQSEFDSLYQELEPLAADREKVRLQKSHQGLAEPKNRVVQAAAELESHLEALAQKPKEDEVATWPVAEMEGLRRRCEQIGDELNFVFGPALDDARFVAYVEGRRRGFSMGAVPIDVADALSKTLLSSARPVVLTSATLSVASHTAAFEEKIGLRGKKSSQPTTALVKDNLKSVLYPSPFDYKHRAALYAPAGMPEPDALNFWPRFDAELRFLMQLSKGGALVLFTSHRAMEATFERVVPLLAADGFAVQKQGDAPKGKLLDALRAATGEKGAVLFATHSFWEGVDVRGRALRTVVIDRLPFRIPTDPVQVARQELIRARGGHPFRDLSLPEAAISLKQGTGRLLRSDEDAGVVAILDGRLRKRPYGKVLLDTLPPMTRIGTQKVLTEFWQRYVSPSLGLTPKE